MQREPDLAGQLGEGLVVLLVEGGVAERAAHDDDAEQLARVRHRRDADRRVELGVVLREQRGEPDADPRRTGHAGARDHRLLLGGDRQLGVTAIGHRDRAFDRAARAGPHLGAVQVHRLLQRLRELEQQLVERQRAREPAPERADHLVRRVLLAVHAPVRVVLEPLARRDPEQRGGRRAGDRQSEHAAFAAVERAAERGDDRERHQRDERGEPAEGDGVDQEAVDAHGQRPVGAERERERDQRRWRRPPRRAAPSASRRARRARPRRARSRRR